MEIKNYYDLALHIVTHAFAGKTDKAGKPYINHLEQVAANMPNIGDYGELRAAALLHDLLEYCPEWTAGALRGLFPEYMVATIEALTRRDYEEYATYINRIKEHDWAIRIKIADLRHNMDMSRLPEITENDIARLRKYHKAYKILING